MILTASSEYSISISMSRIMTKIMIMIIKNIMIKKIRNVPNVA